MAAVNIGQMTGLCVLAMFDTKLPMLSSLLFDDSGGTRQPQQNAVSVHRVTCCHVVI